MTRRRRVLLVAQAGVLSAIVSCGSLASRSQDAAADDVRAAVLKYLELPREFDQLKSRAPADLAAFFGQRVRGNELRYWRAYFDGPEPELMMMAERLAGLRPISPTGPVSVQLATPESATAEVAISVTESFKLDMNLGGVPWLFDNFKIENGTLAQVQTIAESDNIPEALNFDVTTERVLTLSLVHVAGSWLVHDRAVRDRSSRLVVSRSRGDGTAAVLLE